MDLGGAQKRAGGHVAAATPIIVTDGKFESVENIKRAYAAEDAPPTDPLFPLPQVLHGMYLRTNIGPAYVCVFDQDL